MSEQIPQLGEGVHENISPDVYHGQRAYSRSDIVLAATPAKLRFAREHPDLESRTKAKDFGGALHTMLLEPDQFDTRHIVNTRFDSWRTNESKSWRDAQWAKGLTILSPEERDVIDIMVQNAREHPMFSQIFRTPGTLREVTMIARHPGTGLLLRCRPDLLPPGSTMPDIKTCVDASPEGFGKAVWNLNYGFQAAHYLLVHNLLFPEKKREEFLFFCIEKELPYLCALYAVPHVLIEYCGAIESQRLYTLAQCEKTGRWPGYTWNPNDPEFALPGYARHEVEGMSGR